MDETTDSGATYLLPAERLPLFARIALKRMEEQPESRNVAYLAALLTDFARTYGDRANRRIVDSCTWACRGLYGRDSFPMQGAEEGEDQAA